MIWQKHVSPVSLGGLQSAVECVSPLSLTCSAYLSAAWRDSLWSGCEFSTWEGFSSSSCWWTQRWPWWAGDGPTPTAALMDSVRKVTCGGRRRAARPGRGTATQKVARRTRPAWWTAWCVGTNPAASTMAFSPAKGARVSLRGASDGTSTTPAGETHTYYPSHCLTLVSKQVHVFYFTF